MRAVLSHWPLMAAVLLLFGLAGCGGNADAPGRGASPPPVYQRLGGQPVLVAAVDDFMTIAAADPRIAFRFRDTDTTRFKAALVRQLCVSTGGPCEYTGRSMKEAHAGMGISNAEFNAMTQDLRRALTQHGVPIETQTDLVAVLEPMRDDVVSPIPPAQSVVIAHMVRPGPRAGLGKKAVAKAGAHKKAAVAKPTKKKPIPARTH